MKATSHNTGREAEKACCAYLQQQGLKLLNRNYRGRRGEIDLVMRDKDVIVFVEVRYRKNSDYGDGLDSITAKKQQRIIATAEQYMQQETSLKDGRIDVVAMTGQTGDSGYNFEWIRNAF